jgi:hypothetical protein
VVTIDPNGTNYKLAGGQQLINITYQGRSSAKWYVKKYGGGFSEKSKGRAFRVVHQNGLQESTRKSLFFNKHPKVRPGDNIAIFYIKNEKREKREVKPVDWDKLVTKITAFFSALVLIRTFTQ